MGGNLSWIRVECLSCEHKASIDGTVLARKLNFEQLGLKNVADAVPSLKCKDCGKRLVRIFDDRERLLFDSHNLTLCWVCDDPIPLPRLATLPGTTLCIECMERDELDPVSPAYPQPPIELRTCPACKSQSVARQNGEFHTWFIGCSAFPKCRWTTEFPPP